MSCPEKVMDAGALIDGLMNNSIFFAAAVRVHLGAFFKHQNSSNNLQTLFKEFFLKVELSTL